MPAGVPDNFLYGFKPLRGASARGAGSVTFGTARAHPARLRVGLRLVDDVVLHGCPPCLRAVPQQPTLGHSRVKCSLREDALDTRASTELRAHDKAPGTLHPGPYRRGTALAPTDATRSNRWPGTTPSRGSPDASGCRLA